MPTKAGKLTKKELEIREQMKGATGYGVVERASMSQPPEIKTEAEELRTEVTLADIIEKHKEVFARLSSSGIPFTIDELATKLNKDPKYIQSALKDLLKYGLVKTEYVITYKGVLYRDQLNK